MKYSLKEFFMPEMGELPKSDEPLKRPPGTKKIKNLPKGDEPLGEKAGDQFSGPKFGQSSSSEKSRKANESFAAAAAASASGVNRAAAKKRADAAETRAANPSFYDDYPQNVVRSKSGRVNRDKTKDKLKRSPYFEATLKEYEDPTSSKRAEGDSKWATPFSDKERVPHLEPHTDSQENSAEGWEETCHNGPGQSSKSDLKKFFGGAHSPKSSGKSSARSSRKMSEAVDDDAGSSMHHTQRPEVGLDRGGGGAKPNFKCPACSQDSYAPAGDSQKPGETIDCPHCGEHFDEDQVEAWAQTVWPDAGDSEIPSGDMDDFGQDFEPGDDDQEWGEESDTFKGDVPFEPNWTDTTFFNDEEPIKTGRSGKVKGGGFDAGHGMPEEKMSEGGKGSGRKKGSKNKPKTPEGGITQGAGTPSDLPEDPPDDWFTNIDAMGTGAPTPDQPADPSGFEPIPDEPDWASMDDEEFLNKLSAGEGPATKSYDMPKMSSVIKPTGPSYDSHDQKMTYDEFRASDPELAAEFEERYPTDGASFKKKKSGFVHATTKDGRRLFHMGDDRGWGDMDGDEPPGQSTGLGPSEPGEF